MILHYVNWLKYVVSSDETIYWTVQRSSAIQWLAIFKCRNGDSEFSLFILLLFLLNLLLLFLLTKFTLLSGFVGKL